MPKLTLPLSQVHELSVIRDAEGVCTSLVEHARAFMLAMNLVNDLSYMPSRNEMPRDVGVDALIDRAKGIKAMVQK